LIKIVKSILKQVILICVLLNVVCFVQAQKDTSLLSFKGQKELIKYTVGRQIGEASFIIKNNSNKEITVKIGNAYLIRGKSSELLEKVSMKLYYKNKTRKLTEFVLRPKQQITIRISFKPFTIYTGTNYSVMAEIYVSDKKYMATTIFELRQLDKNDKNALKNTDK